MNIKDAQSYSLPSSPKLPPLSPVFHVAGILTSGGQFYPILCPVAVCKGVRVGGKVTLQGDGESRAVPNNDLFTGDNPWLCNKRAQ